MGARGLSLRVLDQGSTSPTLLAPPSRERDGPPLWQVLLPRDGRGPHAQSLKFFLSFFLSIPVIVPCTHPPCSWFRAADSYSVSWSLKVRAVNSLGAGPFSATFPITVFDGVFGTPLSFAPLSCCAHEHTLFFFPLCLRHSHSSSSPFCAPSQLSSLTETCPPATSRSPGWEA